MLVFAKYATDCITILNDNGFEAYFVGGCVRDGLLGKKCDDIDITTNALPEEITAIFPHTIPTGIKHGTVTVIFNNHPIEITTFRKENGYSDNRHPDKISFVSTLEADLSRRDFTINAMACDKDGKIIDLYDGLSDLKKGIIKTVGQPELRFKEDALRILRAYRFASTLNFEIEKNTAQSAKNLSKKIVNLSGERILKELIKLANGLNPSIFFELLNTGSLDSFGLFPSNTKRETINAISSLKINEIAKAALFISLINHDTKVIKSRLKISNELENFIIALDKLSSKDIPKNKKEIKLLLYKFGYKYLKLYAYYLCLSERSLGQNLLDSLDEIERNNEVYSIKQLSVDGKDLQALGLSGPEIKSALEKSLFYVIETNDNTKESILNFLKN